jgi:M6 family metalloprotease-like protein/MYXO-CTERM domain-containing protein
MTIQPPRLVLAPAFLILCLLLTVAAAEGATYRGESRIFQQPNGAEVEVRLFGTELYLRAESADGYALALDRASGFICYAEKAADGGLVATEIRYRGAADAETLRLLAKRGVRPGLRASSAKVAGIVAGTRQSLRQGRDVASAESGATSLDVVLQAQYSRYSPVLGSGKGLVVLVDFSDRVGSIAASEYDKAFNGDTYDSLGSIRTWIESISYAKYTASHTVIGPMRADYPTSHYVGGAEFDYSASRELMKQVFKYIDDQIDLTSYATKGAMPSLVVIYPGAEIAKVWATGLWPHSGEGGYTTSEGVKIPNAFISNGGTKTPMSLSTFRHELGHSLFTWPDTYDYDDDSAGAGGFATETTLPCAPFRAWVGWLNVIDVASANLSYSLPANGDTCLRYKNASNASEFFVLEYMRKDSVKRADTPDEGLLIWHVDEAGDNSAQDMTPTKHYVLSVEQADGLFELEKDGTKRAGDLYHAGYKDRFDDTTTPNSKWWNGSASGLTVCNIGALDPSMSVSVGCNGPVEPASIPDGGAGGSLATGGATGAGGGSGTGGATGAGGARDAGREGAARDSAAEAQDAAVESTGPGNGGSTAAGGTSGSGGVASTGGVASSGGVSGSGGTTASGGTVGSGGQRSTAPASGGASGSASGGSVAAGGAGGGGGGSPAGSGGNGAGGSAAGSGGSAAAQGGSKGSSTTAQPAPSQSGCNCALGTGHAAGLPAAGAVLLLLAVARRRRRVRR